LCDSGIWRRGDLRHIRIAYRVPETRGPGGRQREGLPGSRPEKGRNEPGNRGRARQVLGHLSDKPGFDAVILQGGSEDRGHELAIAAPGLPPLLEIALPKGFLRGGTPLEKP
jgi:hypothetical protein